MNPDPKLQTTPYDIPATVSLSQQEVAEKIARFQQLKRELADVFPGEIAIRGEDRFKRSVRIFNDAAPLGGWLVALPTSARQISTLVKFCNRHSLSPSVRSGGFATAGWAIQGDLIIDTSKMDDAKLMLPRNPNVMGPSPGLSEQAQSVAGLTTLPQTGVAPSAARIDEAVQQDASVALSSASVGDIDRAACQQIHDPNVTPFTDDVAALRSGERPQAQPLQANSADTVERGSGGRVRKADEAFNDGSADGRRMNLPPTSRTSSATLKRQNPDAVVVPASENAEQDDGARMIVETPLEENENLRFGIRSPRSSFAGRGRGGDSGADADSESSDERSGAHADKQPTSAVQNAPSREDKDRIQNDQTPQGYMTGSAPRDQAPMYDMDGSDGSAGKERARRQVTSWVDRQIDIRGNGSASPSGSGSGSTHSSHVASSSATATSSDQQGGEMVKDSSASSHGSRPFTSSLLQQPLASDQHESSTMRSASPMVLDGNSTRSVSRAVSVSESASGSSVVGGRQGSQSQTPDDWDPDSRFEHMRWQKHHRPEGAAGERIKLPPGGFVWRSDGDITTSNSATASELPWDSTAFAASHDAVGQEPTYNVQTSGQLTFDAAGLHDPQPQSLAATSLADLQDAWPSNTWALNTAACPESGEASGSLPRFIPSPLPTSAPLLSPQDGEANQQYNFQQNRARNPSPTSAAILAPGVHEDKYALVSFGPGAGIRGLDAFTDKAGREGNFLAEESLSGKGKGRLDSSSSPSSKSLVINGVPYHVPVSAYPVGSTAMTTGGFGYLTRAYGLSLDNIVEVEMVLADGRIVTLNEDSKGKSQEEADLWWAVRGAAPCFGIVSRIVAKAYPVPSVYSGNLIYPLNPATASSLIRHWRDCLKAGLPNAFYSNLILTAGPSKTSHVIVIQVCFLGPKNEGEALVQAISSWSGERILLKDVEERSFLNQQDGVAKVLKGGVGRRWMVRGDLINTLTDEMISKSVRSFQGLGSRAVWLFELLGGAVEDVSEDETCISRAARTAKFTVGSLQQWSGQAEDQKCIQSVERWLDEIVGKVSIGGPYPCFLGRSERLERVVGAYGPRNFRRLLRIKKAVDPSGLFRHTFGCGLALHDNEVEEVLRKLEAREHESAAGQGAIDEGCAW